MKKLQMRKFTPSDWDGFAGAEGEDPKIGDLNVKMPDGKVLECLVISDEIGIGIYHYEDLHVFEGERVLGDNWKEDYTHLDSSPQKLNDRLLSTFDEEMPWTELKEIGFSEWESF